MPRGTEDCGGSADIAVESALMMNKARRIKTLLFGLFIWCVGSVVLWFTLPYKPRAILTAPEDLAVAGFSPNGRIVATNAKIAPITRSSYFGPIPSRPNGPIRLWRADTGEQIACFPETEKFVRHILFSADGHVVVLESLSIGGSERTISIFDTQSGKEMGVIHQGIVPTFQVLGVVVHGRSVYQCHLTADGKTVAFDVPWSKEGYVKLWDIPTKRVRQTLKTWPAAFSPNGDFLISEPPNMRGGFPTEATIQEVASGRCVGKITCNGRDYVFSPDSTKLLTSHVMTDTWGHNQIKAWDVASGQELATLDWSMSPIFSRNGKRLAARHVVGAEGQGRVKVWDTTTWREIAQLELPDETGGYLGIGGGSMAILAGPGDEDFRVGLAYTRNNKPSTIRNWLARYLNIGASSAGYSKQDVEVLDVASGKRVMAFSVDERSWPHTGKNSTVYYPRPSPDGSTLALEPVVNKDPDNPSSIDLYSIPPDRRIVAIVLWPLLVTILILLIGKLVQWWKTRRLAATR